MIPRPRSLSVSLLTAEHEAAVAVGAVTPGEERDGDRGGPWCSSSVRGTGGGGGAGGVRGGGCGERRLDGGAGGRERAALCQGVGVQVDI